MDGEELEAVDELKYLGVDISTEGSEKADTESRDLQRR